MHGCEHMISVNPSVLCMLSSKQPLRGYPRSTGTAQILCVQWCFRVMYVCLILILVLFIHLYSSDELYVEASKATNNISTLSENVRIYKT